MRFIIYGAGGIGGTIGARLHQAGCDVCLIARGAHREALVSDGLRFLTPEGEYRLQLPVVGHPREITFSPRDVVLLCTKSQHTVAALEDLRDAAGDAVPVVCVQNGVANERTAARRFDAVYAMVVILPAVHLEPGVVVTHAQGVGGILDVGCFPRGIDVRTEAIAAALEAARFSARPDPAVMRWKYAKLLMNLNNALQAATIMGETTRDIVRWMREEALACFRAAGIDCATAEETSARRRSGPRLAEIAGVPRAGGSSWQSLARGTGDIESDYLNGEIVLLGRLHDVPTPVNRVLQRVGHEMVKARRLPGSLPVEDLLNRIEAERSR